MSTKRSIADQILLRISKGYHDSSAAVQLPDVMAAVVQALNTVLKQQYFSQTLQSGDTIPDGAALTTYYNVPVSAWVTRSYCLLPILPLSLPKGLGVFSVHISRQSPVADCKYEFIPLQPGQSGLINTQDYICDLLGNVGYEQHGMRLNFTKDITVDNVNYVDVELIVADINSLGEFDPLPIDPAAESAIVNQLVQQFMPSQTNDDKVDSLSVEKEDKS